MEFDGYFVHGVNMAKVPAKVTYEGEEISADVDTLEVELHPIHGATHGGGSLTLRLRGKNIAEMAQEFETDHTGKLVWVPDGEWHPGKGPPEPRRAKSKE